MLISCELWAAAAHVLISGELQTAAAHVLISNEVLVAAGPASGSEPAAGAIGGADGVTAIGAGSELRAPFLCCDEGTGSQRGEDAGDISCSGVSSGEILRNPVRDANCAPRWGSLRGTMPDGLSFSLEVTLSCSGAGEAPRS